MAMCIVEYISYTYMYRILFERVYFEYNNILLKPRKNYQRCALLVSGPRSTASHTFITLGCVNSSIPDWLHINRYINNLVFTFELFLSLNCLRLILSSLLK